MLALLLAGCAQQDRPADAAINVAPTATTDAPVLACEPFITNTTKLRIAQKSRDEWKAYAERLQLLLPPDSPHESYP